jgi:hypothetical protein
MGKAITKDEFLRCVNSDKLVLALAQVWPSTGKLPWNGCSPHCRELTDSVIRGRPEPANLSPSGVSASRASSRFSGFSSCALDSLPVLWILSLSSDHKIDFHKLMNDPRAVLFEQVTVDNVRGLQVLTHFFPVLADNLLLSFEKAGPLFSEILITT